MPPDIHHFRACVRQRRCIMGMQKYRIHCCRRIDAVRSRQHPSRLDEATTTDVVTVVAKRGKERILVRLINLSAANDERRRFRFSGWSWHCTIELLAESTDGEKGERKARRRRHGTRVTGVPSVTDRTAGVPRRGLMMRRNKGEGQGKPCMWMSHLDLVIGISLCTVLTVLPATSRFRLGQHGEPLRSTKEHQHARPARRLHMGEIA